MLTIGEVTAWDDVDLVFRARLSRAERLGLAYTAMSSLDPDDREAVCERLMDNMSAGMPQAPWLDGMRHEAENWAALATEAEKKILLAAIWDVSPDHIRDGFTNWVRAAA